MITFGQLKKLSRLYVPTAKKQIADDDILEYLINQSVVDIVSDLKLLKKNAVFDVVAGQSDYDISSLVNDFILMDKPGLKYYDGSQWVGKQQFVAVTEEYLDIHYPLWRSSASGTPQYYFKKDSVITVYPTPNATTLNGFSLFYCNKPTQMTNDSDYPFTGNNPAVEEYSVLWKAILLKTRSLMGTFVGDEQTESLADQKYMIELERRRKDLKRRPDIETSDELEMSSYGFNY